MATLNGNGSVNDLAGGDVADVIRGEGGRDKLAGNAGNDVMSGGGGNDVMTGDAGNDVMFGSDGKSAKIDMTKLTIHEDVTAKVTFQGESAGYMNTLGVYKIDASGKIYDVDVLFANASLKGSGGNLIAGKSEVGLDIKAGERVGFFVVPNSYAQKGMDKLLDDGKASWKLVDAKGHAGNVDKGPLKLVHVAPNGKETVITSQYGTDMFHSAKGAQGGLNADGFKHVVGTVDPLTGTLRVGFEDLWKGGDKDFDDSVFTVNIGATNAQFASREATPAAKSVDDDHMSGGAGNDTMYGMNGADKMDGGADSDLMFGGSGDDVLTGGDGNDRIYGNSGNDTILADAGNDHIEGGSGFDTIDFSGIQNGVVVNLNAHSATGAGNDWISGVERVVGTNFADVLIGDKRGNVLEGSGGDDVLRGRGGVDKLVGGDGNDKFVWLAKDLDGAVDHVVDFRVGDAIDLHHMFKGVAGDHSSLVSVADKADGLHISAKVGASFVEFAVIDGHHGATAADLLKSGALLV